MKKYLLLLLVIISTTSLAQARIFFCSYGVLIGPPSMDHFEMDADKQEVMKMITYNGTNVACGVDIENQSFFCLMGKIDDDSIHLLDTIQGMKQLRYETTVHWGEASLSTNKLLLKVVDKNQQNGEHVICYVPTSY